MSLAKQLFSLFKLFPKMSKDKLTEVKVKGKFWRVCCEEKQNISGSTERLRFGGEKNQKIFLKTSNSECQTSQTYVSAFSFPRAS